MSWTLDVTFMISRVKSVSTVHTQISHPVKPGPTNLPQSFTLAQLAISMILDLQDQDHKVIKRHFRPIVSWSASWMRVVLVGMWVCTTQKQLSCSLSHTQPPWHCVLMTVLPGKPRLVGCLLIIFSICLLGTGPNSSYPRHHSQKSSSDDLLSCSSSYLHHSAFDPVSIIFFQTVLICPLAL